VNPWSAVGVLSTVLLATSTVAEAGPITSNTALPVHSGELILREQVVWIRSTGDQSPRGRDLNVFMVPSVLIYGIDARLMVMGVLPFLHKRMAVSTPEGRITRETTGFGDLLAVARYSAVQLDWPGETIRLAPIVGVKLPTGAQKEADALGRFPQPFQLGSGSWDPLAGVVFTWQRLRWELDAEALYQLRTEANAFDAGDEARGDVSFQYRLLPWGPIGPGAPSFFYAVLESSAIWTGKDRAAAIEDPNSGGVAWYVTPGVQWISKRSIVEVALQLPAVQRRNGVGLENDFVAVLSFRRSW
jgi:hypothetical protein